MDLTKIDKLLLDMDSSGATTTDNVTTNTAKGKIDVVGGQCPKGMVYSKEKKTCVPKKNESSVVGGSYVSGNTVNIIGSGQTRVGAVIKRDITVLDRKERIKSILGFDKESGAYIPTQWSSNKKAKELDNEEQ